MHGILHTLAGGFARVQIPLLPWYLARCSDGFQLLQVSVNIKAHSTPHCSISHACDEGKWIFWDFTDAQSLHHLFNALWCMESNMNDV